MLIVSCRNPEVKKESLAIESFSENKLDLQHTTKDGEWKELTPQHAGVILDIRYATSNNFTKKEIYDCPRCYLRPEIADKIIALNKKLMKEYQLTIKLFDCYRPRPAQRKLWDIVPNPVYVTPPEKGSMHNRGMAVDVTLVDQAGEELPMGTDYDYFGVEAHIDYLEHSENILENRKMLQDLMISYGFQTIQSEWWHFSFTGKMYPLSDWEWPCDVN